VLQGGQKKLEIDLVSETLDKARPPNRLDVSCRLQTF
jgi:hypothetical protein